MNEQDEALRRASMLRRLKVGGSFTQRMLDKAANELERQHAEIERLRQERDAWIKLYRRAINEANGLTNYVEERPELRRAERNLSEIQAAARSALTQKDQPKENQDDHQQG